MASTVTAPVRPCPSRSAVLGAACIAIALSQTSYAHDGGDGRDAFPAPGIELLPGVPIDPKDLEKGLAQARRLVALPPRPTLRQLAAESTAIVEGRITRTEQVERGGLSIYHVEVARSLRGAVGGMLALVEPRYATDQPLLIPRDASVVLFVRPAGELPPPLRDRIGTAFGLVGGRNGVVPIADPAERWAVDRALADVARVASAADGDAARAAVRALAFGELGSGVPFLAIDGAAELAHVDPLRDLSQAEIAALRATLRRSAVPADSRAALMRLLADRRAAEALPAIMEAAAESPSLLDAQLVARGVLGAPAGRMELRPHLASADPAERAAAVRALASVPDIDRDEMMRFVRDDPEPSVRLAAVEALGALTPPRALPALAAAFTGADREVREAAGRRILGIGGPAASETLLDLALRADSIDARSYAALLLVTASGRSSERVRRLMAADPPPEIRRLVEEEPPSPGR